MLRAVALVLLCYVHVTFAQCSVVVVNKILYALPTECVSIETVLQGGSLNVAQWSVMCNSCVPNVIPIKETVFLGCDNDAAQFDNVVAACGTVSLTGAPTAAPCTSAPCPECPGTPMPTPAPTPLPVTPEDASGSGVSSVELSGPITTVFIIGVCFIVCIAASGIWYQYIRKTPTEKAQEEKLRNFNLLETQPRNPINAPMSESGTREEYSMDGRSVRSSQYRHVGNESRVLSVT